MIDDKNDADPIQEKEIQKKETSFRWRHRQDDENEEMKLWRRRRKRNQHQKKTKNGEKIKNKKSE